DGVRLLRHGRLEGPAPALDGGGTLRPGELHGGAPGHHLRRHDAPHRVDLGEGLVGALVGVVRGPARALPRALPLLLRLLHAALLARARPVACAHLRGVRAVRGGADPGQLPRHPAVEELHPPGRLHPRRASDDRDDVRRVLRRVGGGAPPRRADVPGGAARQAAGPPPARAARGARRVVSSGEKYVAAAYAVVFATVLVWVALIAVKLVRLERETAEMAELLVWPALLAYGEAALAYAGELRGPGLSGRLAVWGVRLGWIAQTGLLVVQALRADGFPWGTWAGALNLFVWLVVGAYLVWGCNARFRLLGLLVMPPAAALLLASWLGGGTDSGRGVHSGLVLGLHVGLTLAGLAGLSVAGGMAALYLWEERRLKRRDSRLFRLRVPPLDALDRL